jgi:hypothetical protein
MKQFKYDPNTNNIHDFCGLLVPVLGRRVCPYLDNPLNAAKCYATQSTASDSTKSKAISDTVRSLEALGFLEEKNNKYKITPEGMNWVNADYKTAKWTQLSLEGVISYGPLRGFLHQLDPLPHSFSTKGIYIGYPNTNEIISSKEGLVSLTTDSTKDSNTRTVTRLISWCISTGIIAPENTVSSTEELPQLKYRDVVNRDELQIYKFQKTPLYYSITQKKYCVNNPLSYERLHKNVGSIRERGSDVVRKATLANIDKILNRRFIIVSILNKISERNKTIKLNELVNLMLPYTNIWLATTSNPSDIIESELNIADVCGIPFHYDHSSQVIRPLTTINLHVLSNGAPEYVIDIVHTINGIIEGMS